MKSETPLDYAVFQLSPKHSRCELFVSGDGTTEKLASGWLKPFVTHLKVAEEQVALAVQSIRLEVEKCKNDATWFTKGTLERFVRYVSTPEVLELVNTLDTEMSQLEAARRIYSQGAGDQHSGIMGGDGTGNTAAADATKKELLRAIDVRLVAVRQDLTAACARASAAGFSPDTVPGLQIFADWFGAHRLNEDCTKFLSLCTRRPELINQWKPIVDDGAVRSSYGSDMSIDDPSENPCGLSSGPHLPSQNRFEPPLDVSQTKQLSTCQQPKSLGTSYLNQRNIEDEINEVKTVDTQESLEKEVTQTESSSSTPSIQTSRRLSVQDRINLFENKKSPGGGASGGSGGKPIIGKSLELRRLSSDVSLAPPVIEKAVLRRWSGASDMRIDVSCEKKDTESPLCIPSSVSSVSQARSTNKAHGVSEGDQKGLNDSGGTLKVAVRDVSGQVGDSGLKDQSKVQTGVASSGKEEVPGSKERHNWKNQASTPVLSFGASALGHDGLSNHGVSKEKLKVTSNTKERSSGFKDQVGSVVQSIDFSDKVNNIGDTNRTGQQAEVGSFASKGGGYISCDAGLGNKVEDCSRADNLFGHLHSRSFQSHSRSLSGQFEGGSGLKFKEPSSAEQKGVEGCQRLSQTRWRSFTGGSDHSEVELPSSFSQLKVEDSGVERMSFQKKVSASNDCIKKPHGTGDESYSVYENSKVNTVKKASMNQENSATISTPPVEQVRRVRETRGKQGLHDELKMKANELEKLFAEHKLRIPGDQSSSIRKNMHTHTEVEHTVSSDQRKPPAEEADFHFPERSPVVESTNASSNMALFNTSPSIKAVENQVYDHTPKQNLSEIVSLEDSRGKFYETYMQKRDAKLRDEWISKRAEKEAKLKSMQDSLERSRAELKAKFPGSAERQDSTSSARQHAKKLRSFNVSSSMKWEQPIDSIASEEDEELSAFPGEKFDGEDRFSTDPSLGDGASGSYHNKKLLPNSNFTSSTPQTAVAPPPRSVSKIPYPNSGRRRPQSSNPLTQSVPNFSELRKENTKPSYGISKTANRSQAKTYTRSKSVNEDTPIFKEEKQRRSQSLRKSSANPIECKDLCPNSDDIVLAPLKLDKEQTDQSLYDKFSKNVESKPFLRKSNGTGPGSGSSFAKLKTTMPSETQKIPKEFDEEDFEAENFEDTIKEEEEGLDSMVVEDVANIDQGKPRLSHDSDKSGNFESDNGDSMKFPSHVDTSSVAELPLPVSSRIQAVGSLLDSPGESPVSWNLPIHHSFSYQQESSDVDASVDSPIGSPASWNSHALCQTESDAARMRKKWGSAQKPVIATHASHNQSRKDVTKGFKRLLKFGRKSRGTENLVDWISATTSEGDDDTEDGRDPGSRSSEDLRKSRMGYSQGASDDIFNESEFNERVQALQSSIPAPPMNFNLRDEHMSGSSLKAPRSFFSLSSFRSKGGDSKPR